MLLKECKKYSVKCCAIIPDLPRDMYINDHSKMLKSLLKRKYLDKAIKVQSKFDGYIFLTESMNGVINSHNPYIVMEGIAETNNSRLPLIEEKHNPRVIMYAGGLYKKYGIMNLLDAFENANIENTQLWLFGDGDASKNIAERAKHNHQICFWGRVDRNIILEKEREATLLVNVRGGNQDFTKYSFPSKTIEYMLSGTPLLTTKLQGIPEEYYYYTYSLECNDVISLSNIIKEIMEKTDEELIEFGKRGQKFIIDNKNSVAQAKRILFF